MTFPTAKLVVLSPASFGSLLTVPARYPKGRKGYNGPLERSHRTDDEEFYIPYLLASKDTAGLLRTAPVWLYYYNVERPPQGAGRRGLSPLQRRKHKLPRRLALLPPILLDTVSTDIAVNPGNGVLTPYSSPKICSAVSSRVPSGFLPAVALTSHIHPPIVASCISKS